MSCVVEVVIGIQNSMTEGDVRLDFSKQDFLQSEGRRYGEAAGSHRPH